MRVDDCAKSLRLRDILNILRSRSNGSDDSEWIFALLRTHEVPNKTNKRPVSRAVRLVVKGSDQRLLREKN